MQETQEKRVQSLGWGDFLEEEMATQSRILAWIIPWTEELGGLPSMGSQRVRHNWATECLQVTAGATSKKKDTWLLWPEGIILLVLWKTADVLRFSFRSYCVAASGSLGWHFHLNDIWQLIIIGFWGAHFCKGEHSNGQVHKTRVAFGCISRTNFLPLAVPEWWSHIQILSDRYWDQLARSATSIARGGLGCVSGVLGPWIFKSADLRSSHTRSPGTLFNLGWLIRCAVVVKAVGWYLRVFWT